MKRIALFSINWYKKYVSIFLPPACRYTPTCSEYAVIAIQKYGVRKGGWMALKRILRCNPFFSGGEDRV